MVCVCVYVLCPREVRAHRNVWTKSICLLLTTLITMQNIPCVGRIINSTTVCVVRFSLSFRSFVLWHGTLVVSFSLAPFYLISLPSLLCWAYFGYIKFCAFHRTFIRAHSALHAYRLDSIFIFVFVRQTCLTPKKNIYTQRAGKKTKPNTKPPHSSPQSYAKATLCNALWIQNSREIHCIYMQRVCVSVLLRRFVGVIAWLLLSIGDAFRCAVWKTAEAMRRRIRKKYAQPPKRNTMFFFRLLAGIA